NAITHPLQASPVADNAITGTARARSAGRLWGENREGNLNRQREGCRATGGERLSEPGEANRSAPPRRAAGQFDGRRMGGEIGTAGPGACEPLCGSSTRVSPVPGPGERDAWYATLMNRNRLRPLLENARLIVQ